MTKNLYMEKIGKKAKIASINLSKILDSLTLIESNIFPVYSIVNDAMPAAVIIPPVNPAAVPTPGIAEPTAVSLHAVLMAEVSSKKTLSECRILVQGAGAIGLLCSLILSKIKSNNNITISDPNNLRLKECSKYIDCKLVNPSDKEVNTDGFDIVFDTVGLEVSRQQAITVVNPGGCIIHIGLTQPSGQFNFRKATLQEVTFIGTYCYTNNDFKNTIQILANKEIGDLNWVEYRDLKEGPQAFKQIHDGTCSAPKIVLLP